MDGHCGQTDDCRKGTTNKMLVFVDCVIYGMLQNLWTTKIELQRWMDANQ